jgi:hypothetical protein
MALAVLGTLSCAEHNPSVFIEGAKVATMSCSYTVDDTFLTEAVLDTSSASRAQRALRPAGIRYFLVVQVTNQMLDLSNNVYPLRTDQNYWVAQEAEVELRGLDGELLTLPGGLPNPFRVPAMGGVPSAEDPDTPGRGLVSVEVFPSLYGEAFLDQDATIYVRVTIRGTTVGGSTQPTGPFTFPLRLCNGCLFQCATDEMGMPRTALSCVPGQDAVSFVCL